MILNSEYCPDEIYFGLKFRCLNIVLANNNNELMPVAALWLVAMGVLMSATVAASHHSSNGLMMSYCLSLM
jgi:hypothetical protein